MSTNWKVNYSMQCKWKELKGKLQTRELNSEHDTKSTTWTVRSKHVQFFRLWSTCCRKCQSSRISLAKDLLRKILKPQNGQICIFLNLPHKFNSNGQSIFFFPNTLYALDRSCAVNCRKQRSQYKFEKVLGTGIHRHYWSWESNVTRRRICSHWLQ